MLSNISKYRSIIMGMATILIVLCHTTFSIHGFCGEIYRIYIKQFMQCGVDIFFLISGLGCYFSFSNNPSVQRFYFKRMIRIMIPYLLFILIYGTFIVFLKNKSIIIFLYEYSIINFFCSGYLSNWFIGAILVLYLLFPLLYKIVRFSRRLMIMISIIILVILLIPFWSFSPNNIKIIRELFLVRIPVFLIGIVFGDYIYKKKEPAKRIIILVLVFVISVVMFSLNVIFNKYDTWIFSRVLFLPVSVSGVMLISNLFYQLNFEKYKAYSFFVLIGSMSLEMYLVFEKVLGAVSEYLPRPQFIFSHLSDTIISVIINVTAIFLAFILSFVLSKISKVIINRISNYIL